MVKQTLLILFSSSAMVTVSLAEQAMEEVLVTGKLSRYSALKTEAPIMEVSRSVVIESIEDIELKGGLNLDSALGYSSGAFANIYGFATRGDRIAVRGLDILIYQDSLQSLFGNYNNARPELFTLDQVEILKGPASVLYGQGSPGGLINIVSKRPQQESLNKLAVEFGNFNRKQVAMDSTGAITNDNKWLYRLVAVARDTDTQVDFVKDESLIVNPSISWRPSEDTDVSVIAAYRKTDSDTASQFLPLEGTLLSAANGQSIADDSYMGILGFNEYNTTTKSLTLLASHQLNDTYSMEFTARKTRGSADYAQAWPAFVGSALLGNNDHALYIPGTTTLYKNGLMPRTLYRNDATSDQEAADFRFKANVFQGTVQHELMFGLQYQGVDLKGSRIYAAAPGAFSTPFDEIFFINPFNPEYGEIADAANAVIEQTTALPVESSTTSKGFYINDQISIDHWNISLGVRRDTVKNSAATTQTDTATSFSAGLLYAFDQGVSPYINYAESFDTVVGDNGNGQPLKPREGKQWEAGVKYASNDGQLQVNAAIFDIAITNLNDPQARVGTVQQQSGESTIRGFELESKFRFNSSWQLELNLSQLDTEDPEGRQMASVAESLASAWLDYTPASIPGLRAGLGVRYVDDVYGGRFVSTLRPQGVEVYAPSYTLGDAVVGYETGAWDFSVNVRNITDKSYYSSCLGRGDCFVGEARTIIGKAVYHF